MAVEISKKTNKADLLKLQVHTKIVEAITDMKYGSVTLVVQDGHVIQIDRREKIRLV